MSIDPSAVRDHITYTLRSEDGALKAVSPEAENPDDSEVQAPADSDQSHS